ncbi:hypothetical protein DPEC_G00212470 [Dallia pectoralis]|uniref:Uncharacterized protein n=1 Tax=Dallia pectoralis TaxID=75939 RepID=A0ACC2G6S8_DALPE|nr:hypothetical protein DPEC_G00212470 [Dallia pectoralis]
MRTRHHTLALCLALAGIHLSCAQTQEVICSGTQNTLSWTGTQYELMKEKYIGCEIVMGNLEITMMQSMNLSFLQSIKEVTGYVLIAVNQFSRLPLDQLRVIRGTILYEKRFALAVLLNYQIDGEHGLKELGLTHLTEILEGGVHIYRNKFLSYAQQVNWLDIVKDESSEVIVSNNGPEQPCDVACKGHCWGPGKDSCQILTKTVCAPQWPLDTDCFVCRNFNNSGSCMPQCPQTLIYDKHTFKLEPNPSAKYQYGSICVAQCPSNFVVDGSSCVSSCPPNKMEVEQGVKRCEPCGGLCPKACLGLASGQTVDSQNIDSFINCTKIQGSLHFLVTGIEGDPYNKIPPLDPEKLKVFRTVREITDILDIQSWPENLTDLSVFSNLTTIQGRTLYRGGHSKRGYSLLLMQIQSLTSLGLRSLKHIDGGVYITGSKKLCYHHTVNWTRLFLTSSRPQRRQKNLDIKDNGVKAKCVAEGKVCDPLCSPDGCWGPGPDQCLSCKNYSRGGTCVHQCRFLTGEGREFASTKRECMPCHSECEVQEGHLTCTGPGADECVACASLKDGPHCVSSCPEGVMGERGLIFKYHNQQKRCEPCHLNCTQGCSGPSLGDCSEQRLASSPFITPIVLGVLAALFVGFSIFIISILYRRRLAIHRKRAMRRYLETEESFEPLDPGEKGVKHARILKVPELRKGKLLGSGVFGTVHKGIWIPEGDTVKIPVAIKTINDRSGRQTFHEITDHMLAIGSLDHQYIVRLLGICPGASLQLVTLLSPQGSLVEHIRRHRDSLDPQRLLNWCVQIAKGMCYLEANGMVHRNLAARNVLLKSDYMVQISDYGITDLFYPDDKKYLYNVHKTPIKWMALESILFRRYTHQSDVWSYGVTVWEMMSYGAEPYSDMRPQEVPDLLEKGERLSQPHICTIDVYMVMVKCWMIDENVRPTFKELANEFTRMARDPPRYLVIKKGNRSLLDPPPDESSQQGTELGEIHMGLEYPDGEGLRESMDTPPLNLSQARSLSRLSRMESHRGQQGSLAGYLPMTPGLDIPPMVWPTVSRSHRTVSESSEGRCTLVEMEMNEDFSLSGSLRKKRHRGDSAYISQRDSMSGRASDTPSPDTEDEEDQNGYVLPGLGDSPERETHLSTSRCILPHGKRHRISSYSVEDHEDDCEEYEYMNKQAYMMSLSPRQQPGHTKDGSQWLKMDKMQRRSLPSPETERTGYRLSAGENRAGKNRNDKHDYELPIPREAERGSNDVQYEYMDIRNVSPDDPPTRDVPLPGAVPKQPTRGEMGEENVEDEYIEEAVEDNDYQYTNRQPKLRKALRDQEGLRVQAGRGEEMDEYEDMDSAAPPGAGDSVEYENLQGNEEGAVGLKRTGTRTLVKVGEPGGGDRSFDNPDYWQSRLFLKPNTVTA